jgi:hypothetical protein
VRQQNEPQRQFSEAFSPDVIESALGWLGSELGEGAFRSGGTNRGLGQQLTEVDLYVASAEGTYLYEAILYRLVTVVGGDHRARTGGRGRGGGAATAPGNLLFVVDLAKYSNALLEEPRFKNPELQKLYCGVATGSIAGTIY